MCLPADYGFVFLDVQLRGLELKALLAQVALFEHSLSISLN
jgi:hypothetical protein